MLTCLTVFDRQLPCQAASSMSALPWRCRDCGCAIIPLEAWHRYHGALATTGLIAVITRWTQNQLRLVQQVTLDLSHPFGSHWLYCTHDTTHSPEVRHRQ